jgi:hypothetical protein
MSRRASSRLPGWRWAAVALAFPVAGWVGRAISGPVDAVAPALLGGAITAAGLGAAQWWAAGRTFGPPGGWIAATAVGYAVGLAAGGALAGFATDIGSLALMGLVSGAGLGLAQALVLAGRDDVRFAVAWGLAMVPIFAGGWCAASTIGVSVENQFTVFGASGAIVFVLLSGALLAQFPARGGSSRPSGRSARTAARAPRAA